MSLPPFGCVLTHDARRLALEALGVGLIVVRGRKAGHYVARGNDEAMNLLGLGSQGAARGGANPARLASALVESPELSALLAAGEGRVELDSGAGAARRRIEALAFPRGLHQRGIVVVLRDITASAALLEELSRLASIDALTGILNRRRFDELGERDIELARRSRSSIGAIMLDLDLFKRVNDEYGHAVGDEALRTFTQGCRGILRSSDIFGRYGGEEFAILLPGSGSEDSLAVAERLRERAASVALNVGDARVSLTVSIGVYADVPARDDDLTLYLRRADEALYRSKALGRNRSSYWKPL